ncbi:serine/threonine-protein kinase [Meiothermus taiwanensis]|jgi:serine/threonine protein kinase|uniref:Serine/threonine-protein kinase PrkC n=2 Tax=Meiothermus taiwanensis TaxID=172827 RepID=A0A399DYT9_9DEIN|nr:serine/threonine-protein kinase [Meiothermus taiwanensis]AWR86481.1 serine/threonine protein kinase [Meiothermus taiwanensis WR-220]KIQ53886.1 serine protease [Meiothermus taiwanensis]KZK15183.1 serine protease [Meiothermus taiwanensis]RIH77377.1 Serine/threonine-protein kinase PrkC [Meiothermus taiwanensis]
MVVGLAGITLEGRYKVIRPIARGALATVYLAFDIHGTPYALKVFPRGFEGRADREWKVGQQLKHPHINPVLARLSVPHDGGEHPAVLLAFAPGIRLSEWRRDNPARILGVFKHLLEALAHMHGQNLVHRDVKPDNLVVDGTGEARLVDFDLSGPLGERFSQKVRLGTIAYIAPEQIRGRSPTPASDMYSAGILLYWAIAGELPFVGEPVEVMNAHLKLPPPPLVAAPETGLTVTAELQGFLSRLICKDVAERYQNALEALRDFEAMHLSLIPR